MKTCSIVRLAWFGEADVQETPEEVKNFVSTAQKSVYGGFLQQDMGSTTLTLADGSPLHFYNTYFVSVIPKGAILRDVLA